jgi:hypothetical protein
MDSYDITIPFNVFPEVKPDSEYDVDVWGAPWIWRKPFDPEAFAAWKTQRNAQTVCGARA